MPALLTKIKFIFYISCVVCCLSAAGCAWFAPKQAVRSSERHFLQKGRVMDGARLKEGGTLYIVPFSAGPSVEATADLDRAALEIVRATADVLRQGGTRFTILDGEHAHEADLVIRGVITQISAPSQIKKFILRDRRISLAVEGKMIDVNTGGTVLFFVDREESGHRIAAHAQMGQRIGEDIGWFIVSQGETADSPPSAQGNF